MPLQSFLRVCVFRHDYQAHYWLIREPAGLAAVQLELLLKICHSEISEFRLNPSGWNIFFFVSFYIQSISIYTRASSLISLTWHSKRDTWFWSEMLSGKHQMDPSDSLTVASATKQTPKLQRMLIMLPATLVLYSSMPCLKRE